ncbi:MAG TPA: hypothetical protein VIF11_23950 [Methylomirabilota bacterium]
MRSARLWTLSMSLALLVTVPAMVKAQAPESTSVPLRDAAAATQDPFERWDFTLGARIGAPIGHLQVGEFVGGNAVGGAPGTRLSLNTLGIHISEAVEGSLGYHFTADDGLRVTLLYYFLRGNSTPTQSVVYNGEEFKPGSLQADADFLRLDLAYERALWRSPADELLGSVGLAYVYFNPTLTGHGHSNNEDFYLQELPVPIAGLRWTHGFGDHWLLRLGASGGGLPEVNSGRKEVGTVFLQQAHADADAGLVYRWRGGAELELGYHFTYFFQHEKSHEDINDFELIDNGFRVKFGMPF